MDKKTKAVLADKNAKKAKKEMDARYNYSANNAEKAFALLDEMKYEGAKLFDIVFGSDDSEAAGALNGELIDSFSEEKRAGLYDLFAQAQEFADQKDFKKVIEIQKQLDKEFPNVIDTNKSLEIQKKKKDHDFLIDKILKLGGDQTRELASLYSNDKTSNFMEAVGQAKSYIMFLENM